MNLTGGGAERVAASWANGLTQHGHNIYILSDLSNQTYTTDEKVNLIQRKIFSRNRNLLGKVVNRLLNPILAFFQIRKIIKEQKIDAIVDVLYLNQKVIRLARKGLGRHIPIIMTDHNAYERPSGIRMKKRQKRHKFHDNKFFDKVTVLTKRDKDILNEKGFINIKVLHNPLFLEPVKQLPQKENIVLAVGRINEWRYKGFDLLIKAWNKVYQEHQDWKLRIVGFGSESNITYLRNLSNYPESIEFFPYKKDIVEEYRMASIFVLSSRYEGWGLVLAEAMSQGCACVACDYKGRQAELIDDGVNGLLCPPDDLDVLANSISSLIVNPVLRENLASNAIRSLDEFSEFNTALKLEKIIKSTLKNEKNY